MQREPNVETLLQVLELALSQNVTEKVKARAKKLLTRLEQHQVTNDVADLHQDSVVYKDKVVERVMDYVNEHYLEPLSLEGIAEKFHRAPAYLTTRFRQATGLPVMECVLEKRMGEAKHLLLTTSKTVQSIAEHVGYPDLSLFSRQFRRRFGVSPSQWRESTLKPSGEALKTRSEESEKKAKRNENEALLTQQLTS
jgi:AraC-like DNA-binding protein